MLDPDRTPQKDDKGIGANVVAAVLLTVLALPVLVLAACFPAMAIVSVVPNPALVLGGLALAAIALCGALAWHADMPGMRIGFIAAAVEIAAFAAYVALYLH